MTATTLAAAAETTWVPINKRQNVFFLTPVPNDDVDAVFGAGHRFILRRQHRRRSTRVRCIVSTHVVVCVSCVCCVCVLAACVGLFMRCRQISTQTQKPTQPTKMPRLARAAASAHKHTHTHMHHTGTRRQIYIPFIC